ncbi:MAG TPA: hypothetical protein ENM97_04305 [Moorella mulderi]|nr:hypothetical protein [Moorella mulderi]
MPVKETPWGAYMGPEEELLKEMPLKKEHPCFHVFEGRYCRLILARCSRLADEGIDFHRRRPSLEEALDYGSRLPYSL